MDLVPDNELWEWDCYIPTVNLIKSEILDGFISHRYSNDLKESILIGFYPQFIWRSILNYNNIPLIEIWADATEAKNQNPFFRIIFYSEVLEKVINEIFSDKSYREFFTSSLWDRMHGIINGKYRE